ncbi:hypothetical protein Tco_0909661 [Tanacetum coccineum]|uniref:Uncharacterized protein n=1 Tax=Tanacetum coccineum TaxID=301880 RepID=A0ABQ5CU30_9ASTR
MSSSNQQALAEAGTDTRPQMLDKGSCVPWSSRFLRFLDGKKEEGSTSFNLLFKVSISWNSVKVLKCLCVMVKASRSVANKGVEAMVSNESEIHTIEGEVSNTLKVHVLSGVDTNKDIGLGSNPATWWLMISRIYKVYGVDSIEDVLFMVLIRPYKFKIDDVSLKADTTVCLVLGWDKDSIKLKKAVFGFIEDVITKTIDYHLFDVVVEFHRGRSLLLLVIINTASLKFLLLEFIIRVELHGDLILRRREERSLSNNLFLGEYECSSLVLDRDERLEEEIRSIETGSNNVDDQEIYHKTLSTTVDVLKNESKAKDDKYLKEIIDLEKKKKALDNVVYKMAQRKVPELYYGHTIVKQHDALSVIDTEETFELAEESRLKMHAKQNDPIAKDKKVNIAPIDYAAFNKLSEHFVKHFVRQKQLFVGQAFWLPISKPVSETPPVQPEPVLKEIPRELPTISLVKNSFNKMRSHVNDFDKVITVRTKVTGQNERT